MQDDVITTVANPGASGTVYLYDESQGGNGADTTARDVRRVGVNIYADQVVTVFHELLLPGSAAPGTWRAVNGAGDATTINTLLDKDYVMKAGKNRIRIVSTTAPTVWECGGRLINQRPATT